MGKLTFILGGARSGKSQYAQELAKQRGGQVLFIATAQGLDDEMILRIQNHQQARPQHWQTIEAPTQVIQTLSRSSLTPDVILLDCLTLLVSNILTSEGSEERIDEDQLEQAVDKEVEAILNWAATHSANWIIVSNEVGMGLVPPYPLGRVYRDLLGRANQKVAEKADEVFLMVAGIPVPLHAFRK